jgi:hypothetical protein
VSSRGPLRFIAHEVVCVECVSSVCRVFILLRSRGEFGVSKGRPTRSRGQLRCQLRCTRVEGTVAAPVGRMRMHQ